VGEGLVAGGRSLLHLLDRIDERREVLVLVAPAAADPWSCIEQEIEPPPIADALERLPWLCVWALISPGMMRRRLALITSALAFFTAPGETMSVMTSPSMTMSRGSPRTAVTECTNPPEITTMARSFWSGCEVTKATREQRAVDVNSR
jgi:hypothetical protein